jgi:very-short-patch-repair endonuclease
MGETDEEIRRGLVIGQRIAPEKLERAKELRRAMTPEEAILWRALRTNRLEGYHFRRQQVVDGFIADFYCHAAGLVIEVDGGIHRDQRDYDGERDALLKERGLRVHRFTNEDIQTNLRGVLKQIIALCQHTE